MEYHRRLIDEVFDEFLPDAAAISIDGAKGVGKTLTASQRVQSIVAFDDEQVREAISVRPHTLLEKPRPLLIDEWQLLPSSWDRVRRAVDQGAEGGSFLLTGSATVPTGTRIHSGAGRILNLRMRPMSIQERGIEAPVVSMGELLKGKVRAVDGHSDFELRDYVEEILRSGFPGIRNLPPRLRRAQLDGYLDVIVARDLPEQGMMVRKPTVLREWLAAYGAATATTASYTQILDAATSGDTDKPSKVTVSHYRDYLTRVFMLEPLEGWTPALAPLNRLTSAPKHHLVDPALAAQLSGIDVDGLLEGRGKRVSAVSGTWLGALFESLVAQSVRTYADVNEARVYHLRTKSTEHEMDLIVEGRDRSVVAVEVKLGGQVQGKDVKHFDWLEKKLDDRLAAKLVVNTGAVAYTREDGVHVVPLALLGA